MPPRSSAFEPLSLDAISCADGAIENVAVITGPAGLFHHTPAFVPQGSAVGVSGWLIDKARMQACSSAWLCVDGVSPIRAEYGLPSPSVAEGFGTARLANCGFEGLIPTGNVPIGPRKLDVLGMDSQQNMQARISYASGFNVIAGLLPGTTALPALTYPFRIMIERFGELTLATAKIGRSIAHTSGTVMRFSGWTADPIGEKRVGRIFARVGDQTYPGFYGVQRSDVARNFGRLSLEFSGFEVIISTELLTRGPYDVSIIAVAEDETCYAELRLEWNLDIYERAPLWTVPTQTFYEQRSGRIDEIVWRRAEDAVTRPLLNGMVPGSSVVTVSGWVEGSGDGFELCGAFLELDEKQRVPVEFGAQVQARRLGAHSLPRERFKVEIDSRTLALGNHLVRLFAIGSDMRCLCPTSAERTFRVIGSLRRVAALTSLDTRFAAWLRRRVGSEFRGVAKKSYRGPATVKQRQPF